MCRGESNDLRGERDGGLNVFGFEAGEIGKNFVGGISGSEAGEYGTQGDARALKDRFSAAGSFVADSSLFVVFGVAGCAAH